MHPLDFLSGPPTFFIFKKESNKTNFGGVLFLIYLIIIIIITIYYYIDYKNTANFQVQYKMLLNLNIGKEIDDLNANETYNQNITFSYSIIGNENWDSKNDKFFKFYDFKKRDFIINSSKHLVNDTDILVLYECPENNCIIENSSKIGLFFQVSYQGFKIDHQNSNSPFIMERKFIIAEDIYFDNFTNIPANWHNIEYKEKKGSFIKKDNIFTRGYIDDIYPFISKNGIINDDEGKNYIVLANFYINNKHIKRTQYERTSKSILDYIANVFSFYSNVFFIVKYIFSIYSPNFNNYKIIEKNITKKLL